jgi:DNA-binding GntR family transcriptional regulator
VRARDELRAVLAALERRDEAGAEELLAGAIAAFRDELVDALRRAALDIPLGVADL